MLRGLAKPGAHLTSRHSTKLIRDGSRNRLELSRYRRAIRSLWSTRRGQSRKSCPPAGPGRQLDKRTDSVVNQNRVKQDRVAVGTTLRIADDLTGVPELKHEARGHLLELEDQSGITDEAESEAIVV